MKPDDLASIVYTSGTTGDPKGVMLTQDNLVSNVHASLKVLPIGKDDVALSALPYSHVFERMVANYLYPAAGTSIAIAGSLEEVPSEPRRDPPDGHDHGAAFLRKALRARQGIGRSRKPDEAEDLQLGHRCRP